MRMPPDRRTPEHTPPVSSRVSSRAFRSGSEERVLAPALKRQTLSLSDIAPLFSRYKIELAAKQLGVGVTCLKRRCRELGVPLWPYRQARLCLSRAPLLVKTNSKTRLVYAHRRRVCKSRLYTINGSSPRSPDTKRHRQDAKRHCLSELAVFACCDQFAATPRVLHVSHRCRWNSYHRRWTASCGQARVPLTTTRRKCGSAPTRRVHIFPARCLMLVQGKSCHDFGSAATGKAHRETADGSASGSLSSSSEDAPRLLPSASYRAPRYVCVAAIPGACVKGVLSPAQFMMTRHSTGSTVEANATRLDLPRPCATACQDETDKSSDDDETTL